VSRARFVVPALPAPGDAVRLPPEEASHARSRRVARGDRVVLIDGSGREAEAEVLAVLRGAAEVRVLEVRDAPDLPLQIWLAIAGIRGERLSWVAEKAGELGVARLSLVRTERTQVFRAAGAALERVERIVRESAKQSGSARWPACDGPLTLEETLASATGSVRLILDGEGAPFLRALAGAPAAASVSLLVGPEGGFTNGERDLARSAGWIAAALPAGTLRAETAAIAAIVLARAAFEEAHRW
jgi:16S rRNA (uracil1498-N3)-methyltransferase